MTGVLALQGGTEGMTLPPHLKAAVKTTPGPSGKTELSWLMRTTYISNDSTERRQQGITEKRAKAERQAQEEAPADTREAQMEAIKVSMNSRPIKVSCPAVDMILKAQGPLLLVYLFTLQASTSTTPCTSLCLLAS